MTNISNDSQRTGQYGICHRALKAFKFENNEGDDTMHLSRFHGLNLLSGNERIYLLSVKIMYTVSFMQANHDYSV